ncbi:hypothetical protein E2C01_057406 [Portunus trituberculatus]|uniref:Secreted protein n=1 Tax=Portunus trituberculatus TaxID=210409 RepID=A0A5B7H089_PORTR|nr:hypothetical protein [Portunus trituberculatus]
MGCLLVVLVVEVECLLVYSEPVTFNLPPCCPTPRGAAVGDGWLVVWIQVGFLCNRRERQQIGHESLYIASILCITRSTAWPSISPLIDSVRLALAGFPITPAAP